MNTLQQKRYEAQPQEPGFPRSEHGRPISEAEYWKTYYNYVGKSDFRYEWNNGYLEEIPGYTYAAVKMQMWLDGILYDFIREAGHGTAQHVIMRKIGFRLALPDRVAIRKPASAVVSDENPVRLQGSDSVYSGIFDICIDTVSDISDETVRQDTVIKKDEYEAAGVREYYVLDSEKRHTAFYRLDSRGRYEHIKPDRNDIVRSDVLPGFQFRVSDLYRQPSMTERAEDKAYPYIMAVYYQILKKKAMETMDAMIRAEAAEKQAAAQKRRAKKAEAQVRELKAKLRASGIPSE